MGTGVDCSQSVFYFMPQELSNLPKIWKSSTEGSPTDLKVASGLGNLTGPKYASVVLLQGKASHRRIGFP